MNTKNELFWSGDKYNKVGKYSCNKLAKICGTSWGIFQKKLAEHNGDVDATMQWYKDRPKNTNCLHCNKGFPASSYGKKFCTEKCRYQFKKAMVDNWEVEPDEIRVCVECGDKFPVYFLLSHMKKRTTCDKKICKNAARIRGIIAANNNRQQGDGELVGLLERQRDPAEVRRLLGNIPNPTALDDKHGVSSDSICKTSPSPQFY